MDYMDYYKELIKSEFHEHEVQYSFKMEFERAGKCEKISKDMREMGNELFTDLIHDGRMHERIWDCYLWSIAHAPNNSDCLVLSYNNYSAFLYHIYKYEDCLKCIEKTLKMTITDSMKVKLLCRKVKCFTSLRKPETFELLEEVKALLKTIDDNHKDKQDLVKRFIKTKNVVVKNRNNIADTTSQPDESEPSTSTGTKKKKMPKKNKESNHLQILEKRMAQGIFDSVTIRINDIFGRHMVASRDIKPGEIIFARRPYIRVCNFEKSANFCNNCLRALMYCIPCENCAWCLYCSEECKSEAEQKYHDIECDVLQFLVVGKYCPYDYHLQGSLRAVVMGVKEFGSIQKLREEIESVDCKENGGFSKDGKFRYNSFVSIFGFKTIYVEPENLSYLVRGCCRCVIGLAKFTSFFGDDFKLNAADDILSNEDTMFICALLLKVAVILYNNGMKVKEQDSQCREQITQILCNSTVPCCDRGFSLNTVSNLIPHSCDPNVKSVKTDDCVEIYYALQPIPKFYPLLECYGCTFYDTELADRYEKTAKILRKYCTCIACMEQWPAVLLRDGEILKFEKIYKLVIESREYKNEKKKFAQITMDDGLSHQKVVNELSKIISANFDYFGQPSAEMCASMCLLSFAFNDLYGLKADFPDTCRSLPERYNSEKKLNS